VVALKPVGQEDPAFLAKVLPVALELAPATVAAVAVLAELVLTGHPRLAGRAVLA
jgi:hypothetical protein